MRQYTVRLICLSFKTMEYALQFYLVKEQSKCSWALRCKCWNLHVNCQLQSQFLREERVCKRWILKKRHTFKHFWDIGGKNFNWHILPNTWEDQRDRAMLNLVVTLEVASVYFISQIMDHVITQLVIVECVVICMEAGRYRTDWYQCSEESRC